MSEIGQSTEELSKELYDFCHSHLLSEEGLREIIDRHGLKPNNTHLSNYEFFFEACFNERITEGIIQCLLAYFPAAGSGVTDEIGRSPLHCVCMNNSATLNIIQRLIEAAPDTVRSATNNNGFTPLHFLCKIRKVGEAAAIQILTLLIEASPDAVRHADNNGRLPIHWASLMGRSLDFCRLLIEAYPGSERITTTNGALPLHVACARNSLATVEYFFSLYPAAIAHTTTRGGIYPIHTAILDIKERDCPLVAVKVVQFLLDCDPNVKLQKCDGKSLLHFACGQLYYDSNSTISAAIEMIKAIYDSHPEAIEDDEITSEIQHCHQRIQAFLNSQLVYARQAKDLRLMTTPDSKGKLPLHTALQNKVMFGSIRLLVKGNPHALQSPDNSGALPLHIACQHHDSASVRRRCFLHYWSRNIIQYLLELDASTLGTVDREGNTALHYACRGAKYDIIALLLGKYDAVSVSKRNVHGKLPIDLLWESNEVSDRESLKHTEMVFRLMRAYPEIVAVSDLTF